MEPLPRFRALGVLSPGLMRTPHLGTFLPEAERVVRVGRRLPACVDGLAGWGHGPASLRARRLAEQRGLPFLAIEDGFIRSLGPADAGFAPISLVVDARGIHYDASRPSALENLLQHGPARLGDDAALAALARVRCDRLTRVNTAPDLGPGELDPGGRPLVVVIDQERGQASVELGLGSARQFHDMLDAALDENAGATVVVKVHPDVLAGRREGYLAGRARALGVTVLARDVNPLSLVERASRVYTVTSQVGMEALLCGTPVTCFGMPFYAGWGATDDRVVCRRRTRRRSPLEIFAAAYLSYARYVDPITGRACSLADAAARLSVMKRAHERTRGHVECLGFPRRERRLVRPFLAGTRASPGFALRADRGLARAAAAGGRACVWAAREQAGLAGLAQAAGVPLVRVAPGVLPSVGPGADRLPGGSLVFDRRGIWYDPRRLSELEEILEFEEFDPALLDRAAALRRRLVAAGGTGRGLRADDLSGFAGDRRRRILVPGEALDDPAVRQGGGALRDNRDLLRAVRERCPEAWLVFRPRPEVEAGRRPGRLPDRVALRDCDHVLHGASLQAAIEAVDEVHALTSEAGFEALLRGRKVVTYGAPFYAGWGLTEDRARFPRRTRRLTLDQLVAGALLVYPHYVDPVSRLPCDAETVVERLAEARRCGATLRSPRPYGWRLATRVLRGLLQAAAQPG